MVEPMRNNVIPDALSHAGARAEFLEWMLKLSNTHTAFDRFVIALIWERVTSSTLSRSEIETILSGKRSG